MLRPNTSVTFPCLNPPPTIPSKTDDPELKDSKERFLLIASDPELPSKTKDFAPAVFRYTHRCLFNLTRGPAKKSEVNNQPPTQTKRPLSVLQKSTNKVVSVRLKSELDYRGRMSNVDPYMNVILLDAEESENGNKIANYGKVVIRGNNVLYIKIEDKI